MKITIELTENEVKGIKQYLKDVCDIPNPKKEDIRNEIAGIVNGVLQSTKESIADYIKY
jgi:hypothetical protein